MGHNLPSMCDPQQTQGQQGFQADIPQLFSGDEHLGQPLQLCSLLLHGVPDPVHLSANIRCTHPGCLDAKQSYTKNIILHWEQFQVLLLLFIYLFIGKWIKKMLCGSFLADKYTEKGTNGLKNKGVQASTLWWFQRINNALTPQLTLQEPWGAKRRVYQLFLWWMRRRIIPSQETCNNAASHKSEPSLSVPAAPPSAAAAVHFLFLRNIQISAHTN